MFIYVNNTSFYAALIVFIGYLSVLLKECRVFSSLYIAEIHSAVRKVRLEISGKHSACYMNRINYDKT